MSDTPLYDLTLSDVLHRARREADERVAEAERRAAQAEQRTVLAEQRAGVRAAIAQAAVEAATTGDRQEAPERSAPQVPSMADLLLPSPGVNRFLDSLLGDQS